MVKYTIRKYSPIWWAKNVMIILLLIMLLKSTAPIKAEETYTDICYKAENGLITSQGELYQLTAPTNATDTLKVKFSDNGTPSNIKDDYIISFEN